VPVEVGKPAEERGLYLHHKAYGAPETMGLKYKEMQALKARNEQLKEELGQDHNR
jgi:hypothetical protein